MLSRSPPCSDHKPKFFSLDDGARTANKGNAEGRPEGTNTVLREPCGGSWAKHEADDRQQQPLERNDDAAPQQRLHRGPCQAGEEEQVRWRRTGEDCYGRPLDASGRSAA